MKKAAPVWRGLLNSSRNSALLRGVEFDDLSRFHLHRVWHIRQFRHANEGCRHRFRVNVNILGNVAFGTAESFQNQSHVAGLLADLNHIAWLQARRTDVATTTIDQNVAVIDELTRCEDRRHEFRAVNDGIEAGFQKTDQVFGRVAFQAVGFFVNAKELLFRDVAVVAFQLLRRF